MHYLSMSWKVFLCLIVPFLCASLTPYFLGHDAIVSGITIGFISTAIASWLIIQIIARRDADFAEFIQRNSRQLAAKKIDLAEFEDDDANPTQQRVAFQDLTMQSAERLKDLLETNEDLANSRTRFQSILMSMSEGVLLIDKEGTILYSNSSAGRLLDRKPQEMEGRHLWEVVRNADLHAAIEHSNDSLESFRQEFELLRTKSIVEVTAGPIEVNSATGLLIVMHDVTELRRLERMRQEFVSNVSHELKTPLTAIQAYADTLLDGAIEDPDNSHLFLTRIVEQSDRLQELIQDMLRLARIETQADAFQLVSVSLTETLEGCVESRQTIARSRGIHLDFDPESSDQIDVTADREGLRTIFDNLINNSLNYTEEGGQVIVRCRTTDDCAVVEVEDNGIGIPGEHHSRIFERFYRVDKARARGMGGTGLGLAIVKHCVNLFQGQIELESEVGQGTLFRVSFPLANQTVDEPQPVV